MSPRIELRAFMGLSELLRKRNWSNPLELDIEREMTGVQLLAVLDIRLEKVKVFFVSGKAFNPAVAVVTGGDRVALVPPGGARSVPSVARLQEARLSRHPIPQSRGHPKST